MLEARISTRLALSRLDANDSFRAQAYLALKQAISAMDLYDQHQYMEKTGQWRFTPPTHVMVALHEAITQFEE